MRLTCWISRSSRSCAGICEPVSSMRNALQALDDQAAEDLHDRTAIERREGQKLAIGREDSIGNDRVSVRIPVCPIGPVRLQRNDAAGAYVVPIEQRLESLPDRRISAL